MLKIPKHAPRSSLDAALDQLHDLQLNFNEGGGFEVRGREFKEARNHQFKKPVVNQKQFNKRAAGARVKGVKPPAPLPEVKPQEEVKEVKPEPEKEVRGTNKFHVGCLEDPGGYVFGMSYYEEPVYEIIRPGVFDDVVSHGPGWVEFGPRGRDQVYVGSAWRAVSIPKYDTGLMVKEEQDYELLAAVLDGVDSKMRLSNISAANLTSLQNLIGRTITPLPLALLDKHKNYLYDLCLYSTIKHERLMRGILTLTDRNPYAVLEEYDNDAMISVELDKPVRIKSATCDLEIEYEADPDIVVTGDVVERADGAGNVHSLLQETDDGKDHWYRTCMFSLEGTKKFVEYEKNDRNANKALKRLVGVNKNHLERKFHESVMAQTLAAKASNQRLNHVAKFVDMCAIPTVIHANRYVEEDVHRDDGDDQDFDCLLKSCFVNNRMMYAPVRRQEDYELPNWYTETAEDVKDFKAVQLAAEKMIHLIQERFDRSWVDFVLTAVPQMGKWVYFETYLGFMEYVEPLYSRWKNAEIPHVKKKLRQMYVSLSGSEATDDIMVTRLEAQVKRELAKAGKVPRIYVGYEAGCMYANELPEFIKVALQQKICLSHEGHFFTIFCFTKPRSDEIDEVFNTISKGLSNAEHIICIYSDDSVWSGCVDYQCYAFNCDIEACDASVKSAGFFMSGLQFAGFDVERSLGLIQQCKLPITMRSYGDRTKKIRLQRVVNGKVTPIEGSGTVMTTVNNFNVMLLAAFVYIFRGSGYYGLREGVIRAGLLTGLNLDVSENFASIPEKIQFLKFSPVLCEDGNYHMVRNLGTMMRSAGKIDGDMEGKHIGMLPSEFGRTDWNQRMELFYGQWIQGYKHDVGNPILDAFRARFTIPFSSEKESTGLIEQLPNTHKVVLSSLASRYDVTEQELLELGQLIQHLRVGSIIVNEVLSAIYKVDYGL